MTRRGVCDSGTLALLTSYSLGISEHGFGMSPHLAHFFHSRNLLAMLGKPGPTRESREQTKLKGLGLFAASGSSRSGRPTGKQRVTTPTPRPKTSTVRADVALSSKHFDGCVRYRSCGCYAGFCKARRTASAEFPTDRTARSSSSRDTPSDLVQYWTSCSSVREMRLRSCAPRFVKSSDW